VRALILALALSLGPVVARAQPPSTAAPRTPLARAARALVTLEDTSGPRGLGVVLAGTGRILTALEPIHAAGELRVAYPDGRRDRVRIMAVDVSWGVALLEGEAGTWPEGIELAERDARTRDAVSWFPAAGSGPSGGTFLRRRSFVGNNASLLRDAWELDPVPAPTAVGSPLLHPQDGTLLGVVVPPSTMAITGAEVAFGVPLPVLRALVQRAGESTRPWVGITFAEVLGGLGDVASPGGGLRVRVVDPTGPGARAGLRGGPSGDMVVAVDGRPVHSIAGFGEIIAPLRAGDTITLQVLRRGATTDVPLTLAERPREPSSSTAPRPAPRAPARPTPRR
jgi:S1-C subfamily serine protease